MNVMNYVQKLLIIFSKNMKKNKNIQASFKGWKLVSSAVISLSGQAMLMPYNQALASVFVGVHELHLLSVNEAKKVTFPEASSFIEVNLNITDDLLKQVAKKTKISKMAKDKETKVFQALDSKGKNLGYFFTDKVYGKHELITYSVGIDANDMVKHVEILDYRETYGWQIDNKKWREQFVGKNVESKLVLDDDIKNISGATLSCKHVTDGVKRILTLYEIALRNKA